jgi:eukaryotic-like serine/threonine-protein kinase
MTAPRLDGHDLDTSPDAAAQRPAASAGGEQGSAPTLAVSIGHDAEDRTARSLSSGIVGELPRGSLVGRYTILSLLGMGGMGAVYAAYDPELDRNIALKLLAHRGDDPAGRARLLGEAQAMAQLAHPNVVAVHDAGTVGDHVWIAMEVVHGQTLTKWLDERKRGWREILAVFRAAGEGLRAAHAAGLVHHDFKPDNVMVGTEGRVRVMDFGLARADRTAASNVGALMGTPLYMAPEQWEAGATDPRTDQFSFCVALWEALHGELPFAGDTLATRALAVTTGRLRAVSSRGKTPGWLRQVILRGLDRDPEQRWPTTEALLAALARDPTRRNRAIVGIAASAFAAVGALAWMRLDEAARVEACDEAADALAKDWNDDVRREIRDGMLATEVVFAEAAFASTAARLDEYTASWSALRRQSCMDATVAQTLDADTHARALACLEDRRVELGELVGVLRAPDRAAVQQAVVATAGLSELAACVDPIRLAHQDPTADVGREEAVAVRRGLARVRALELAGVYAEAGEAVATVEDAVVRLDLPVLEARVALTAGSVAARLGDFERARGKLEAAYHAAGRQGADSVAAEAATALALVVGYQQASKAAGLGWARQAEMWLDRIGTDAMDQRRAALATAVGLIHQTSGAHDEAMAAFQRALAIVMEVLGESHPEVAMAHNNIGFAQAGRGAYAEARASFERALALSERTLGPDHPECAGALNNLGSVAETLGDYEAALSYHRRGLAIDERTLGPDHPDFATTLNNLGMVQQSRGEREEARDFYQRALAIRERALGKDHPGVGAILNNLATLELELGENEQALRDLEAALAVLEANLGSEHPHVAVLLLNIGRTHERLGADDDALEAYRRGLALGEQVLPAHDHSLLLGNYGVGRILLERGEVSAALAPAERALAICEPARCKPSERASLQFLVARTLVAAGGDPGRAHALAGMARDTYAADPDAWQANMAAIDAWLAEAPAPTLRAR